jgi:YgiT-type zinc finger domain-containing protein
MKGAAMTIKTCPTCGQRSLERRRITLNLEVRGRTFEIPELELEVCSNCGEQLFDLEASRRVEEVVYGKRRGRKTPATAARRNTPRLVKSRASLRE